MPRRNHTKQEAINIVLQKNKDIHLQHQSRHEQKQNDSNVHNIHTTEPVVIECVNAHHIYDPEWELGVTLNLSPGTLSLFVLLKMF